VHSVVNVVKKLKAKIIWTGLQTLPKNLNPN
jgi:hypothetical protein